METVMLSYYDILGVARDSRDIEIKKAYRNKAAIYHPDKVHHLGMTEQKAAEMEMKFINTAKEILLDKVQRYQYDLYLDGALEADKVEDVFIVAEIDNERSPLWKKVLGSIGRNVEKGMAMIKPSGEEYNKTNEIEVEPFKEKTADVVIIAEIDEDEGNDGSDKKAFKVVGIIDQVDEENN